jgi:hypothetical protein
MDETRSCGLVSVVQGSRRSSSQQRGGGRLSGAAFEAKFNRSEGRTRVVCGRVREAEFEPAKGRSKDICGRVGAAEVGAEFVPVVDRTKDGAVVVRVVAVDFLDRVGVSGIAAGRAIEDIDVIGDTAGSFPYIVSITPK